MKKKYLALIPLIFILLIFATGCSENKNKSTGEQSTVTTEEPGVTASQEITRHPTIPDPGRTEAAGEREETRKEVYYSPFTGKPLPERSRRKAVMVSIENSKWARPQSGLAQAEIVYEFLAEGGITRFLALYGRDLPEEVGPIRSVRPYLIETARDYNALLLHAGASPTGFAMLSEGIVDHLDQIYKSGYFWRVGSRKAPHNLYTGADMIDPYRAKLTGQEYESRFSFQQFSFIKPEDKRADRIEIGYWGGYTVIYIYDKEQNRYLRYLYDLEQPHKDESGEQLTARNIIVQYSNTDVIDNVGRLQMDLRGRDQALIFRDGIVIKGYWEKKEGNWTEFFDQEGNRVSLNPGQTWIQVVPRSAEVNYQVFGGGTTDEKESPDEE